MSNFWANKLGGAAPAAPAPAPQYQQQGYQQQGYQPPPQQAGPWWDNGIYAPQPQHQQTVPPQYQQQGYQQGYPQQGQPVPDDGQQKHIGDLLRDPFHVPKKAKVLKQTGQCPDCGSGDYFRSPEHPNSMPQCQECGYNPRFHQQTAGTPSGGQGQTHATPSRQTAAGGAGGRSNYNPQVIVNAKANAT